MTALSPRHHHLALASALLALPPGAARADQAPPAVVSLRTSSCGAPHDAAALRQAIDIELDAMHVEHRWEAPESGSPPARVTLNAECEAETGAVELRVWANTPRLVVQRSVPLGDVPAGARPRTLALVISEALGPALAGAAPQAPAAPAPLEPARAAAPRATPAAVGADAEGLDAERWDELFTTVNPYGPWRAFRIAAAAHARLALRDPSGLLAFEVGARAPFADRFDWTFEASHTGPSFWTQDPPLDVSWWSASFGADWVHARALAVAVGPRLSFGYVTVASTSDDALDPEHTLTTQLGVRGKVDLPITARSSMEIVLSAQRTLGVLALTHYTGLDHALNGWVVSWGLGYAVEP